MSQKSLQMYIFGTIFFHKPFTIATILPDDQATVLFDWTGWKQIICVDSVQQQLIKRIISVHAADPFCFNDSVSVCLPCNISIFPSPFYHFIFIFLPPSPSDISVYGSAGPRTFFFCFNVFFQILGVSCICYLSIVWALTKAEWTRMKAVRFSFLAG